ncbi:hypothetical protein J2S16_003589 [Cytobacillus kochii]|nr:hypothetical protein [Cytobacillus kochii]
MLKVKGIYDEGGHLKLNKKIYTNKEAFKKRIAESGGSKKSSGCGCGKKKKKSN